jgi:hypothetical protein
MADVIKDGSGGGYTAKVDEDNRLHTHAATITDSVLTAAKGDAYNINTGLISVTGDATMIYLKNNETKSILVESIIVGSFEGITHSDDPYLTMVRNPTGGDLIGDGTAVSMNANRNGGSSKTLAADAYKGKVSGTLSGGSDWALFHVTPGGRSSYPINFILEKGTSLGLKLTANASSGTANYYVALVCYLTDVES